MPKYTYTKKVWRSFFKFGRGENELLIGFMPMNFYKIGKAASYAMYNYKLKKNN